MSARSARAEALPASTRAPLRNVLVATDFSETATWAVERATRLPLAPLATVTLLHVLPFVARADPPASNRALEHAVSFVTSGLARIGRTDVSVASRMGHGMPYVDVAWVARRWKHDLVVVGRHGERRFLDALLGSTAEHVVHACEIPVLVVAARPTGCYRHPLVAVDCSEGSRNALELARRVCDAPLEVVSAYELDRENVPHGVAMIEEAAARFHAEAKRRAERTVQAFVESHGVTADVVVREGVPRRVIFDVALQHECDLLVVGAYGRTGLAQLRLGSVSEAVLREAPCDVLVARAEPVAPERL